MNNNSYKAQTAKARSWGEIENHYLDLINHGWKHEPMLELVRYIRQTDLAERLYGYTSFMDKLVISIYDPVEWNREALHITHNQRDKWTFEYYAVPLQKPEFVRNYESEQGIEKFKDFIEKKIKW